MRVELHHTRTTPRYGKQLLPKESLCRRHEVASKKTAPQRAPFAMTAERFSSPLVVHTLQIQQERVLERNIFVLLVAARNTSMSRFHLGLEQDIVVICFHRPELCGPLCRLEILHLRIEEACCYEDVGICLCLDIVVRRVGEHILIVLLVVRISPFIIFRCGQRNALIQHCCYHVHPWNIGNNAFEEVGAHVDDGAHQQPAGTSTLRIQVFRTRVALFDEVFGTVDEVCECILLLQQLAVVVPDPSQFLSSANMGYGIDKAAVKQTYPRSAESSVPAGTIGAVSVQEKRILSIL